MSWPREKKGGQRDREGEREQEINTFGSDFMFEFLHKGLIILSEITTMFDYLVGQKPLFLFLKLSKSGQD